MDCYRQRARNRSLFVFFTLLSFLAAFANSEKCSKANPCATGCCSRDGFCGIGDEYCSPEVCIDTCDLVGPTAVECDKDKHCPVGCCSKYNSCGYGPDYCAAENCLSTCDRKSECDPGGFGSYAQSKTCPLNVCCSKYGFCGTTKDFCGNKKVKSPSCPEKETLHRVVGYYEGWAARRSCNDFWPEQIPPDTFEIIPAAADEVRLYHRLTALKEQDPFLKVNIALGGWTFNDPGATFTTFSDIARSEENQKKFFKSLVSFLATYNFDGVDLDWEYPVDPDRGGRPEDFEDFPRFMTNLKKVLKGTGGRDHLSITLPASYWYLQHFDLKKLMSSVDYFNIMSYDLHGKWDLGNKWTGNFLNSHTNATEIEKALELLWRNDVDPERVVLGLAFYGRAFTVENTACTKPGCTFASAADAGRCSREAGILMNNEIDDIAKIKGLTPTLDEDAMVKILSWDDQWVTYDDDETFSMRIEYAMSRCLGGVMVWAVSHDTRDGKYSQELGTITRRAFTGRKVTDGDDGLTVTLTEPIDQCKWTGCGEHCPKGYVVVKRSDPGAREDEGMWDETGCADGFHTWCCPTGWKVPKCGWYDHNNGKCEANCPDKMIEIGSNSAFCNNAGYQAACCEFDTDSMDLYGTLEWSAHPNCDEGGCPWINDHKPQTLTDSTTGSGGAECIMNYMMGPRYPVPDGRGRRKLCYGDRWAKGSWESCFAYDYWYGGIAVGYGARFCAASCPDSMVRLAMDSLAEDCTKYGGAQAFCCSPEIHHEVVVLNPELERFREVLETFMANQTCPAKNPFEEDWSSSLTMSLDLQPHKLTDDDFEYMIVTVAAILSAQRGLTALQRELVNIWNEVVQAVYSHLSISSLQEFIYFWRPWRVVGSEAATVILTCSLDTFDERISDEPKCSCIVDICEVDPEYCSEEATSFPAFLDRHAGTSSNATITTADNNIQSRSNGLTAIEKRGNAEDRSYSLTCAPTGDRKSFTITSFGFPSNNQFPYEHDIYFRAIDFLDPMDCSNPMIHSFAIPEDSTTQYNAEHIIELQTITLFFNNVGKGELSSGKPSSFYFDDCDFFSALRTWAVLDRIAPTFPGGSASAYAAERIMDAFGSWDNLGYFWLVDDQINSVKARLWSGISVRTDDKMMVHVKNINHPEEALGWVRATIAVFNYLNHPGVHTSMVQINRNIRHQFALTEYAFGRSINLVNAWEEFLYDLLDNMVVNAAAFVDKWLRELLFRWILVPDTPEYRCLKAQTLQAISALKMAAQTQIRIDKTGLGPLLGSN